MKGFHWCDFEWDKDCFPDIKGTLQRYHEKGLKICAWINPYIAQGTSFFKEGAKHCLLYTSFIEGCAGALTEEELNQLVNGAKMMTLECGIRFLTDYLEGDHYFKIHRDGQNLDRCRTQFKLVADMEQKEMEMQEIVNKYR